MATREEKLTQLRRHRSPFEDVLGRVNIIQGKDGHNPQKGVDYLTPEEVQLIIREVASMVKRGIHYLTPEEINQVVQEVISIVKEGKQGPKGEPGKDGVSIQGKRGLDGVDGVTPVRGKNYWTKEDKQAILQEIEKILLKKEIDVKALVDKSLKEHEIDYNSITNAPKIKDLNELVRFLKLGGYRGGGSSSTTGSLTYAVDLSAQCDGAAKVFTVPSNTNFILLTCSDSPFIYRPIVDYTGSGTITLTLDAAVNAPSLGATLVLTYIA